MTEVLCTVLLYFVGFSLYWHTIPVSAQGVPGLIPADLPGRAGWIVRCPLGETVATRAKKPGSADGGHVMPGCQGSNTGPCAFQT